MKYYEAIQDPEKPLRDFDEISYFMAGGITGCPGWQDDVREFMQEEDVILVNPRRKDFDALDPDAEVAQIAWEAKYLQEVDRIMFWFPKETLCPITLFELGAWSHSEKPILVGVHPDYKRKRDVEIQMKLRRPEVEVVYSVEHLVKQVKQELIESKEFDLQLSQTKITVI